MAENRVTMGWLDLGEKATARASDYIASMRTPGAVDELGFGMLRDAFSDRFFPATNTIMTRTRYMLFVPYLCLRVEKERFAGDQAARRLRSLENELRESLAAREKNGVIGKSAKEKLKRYPSNIYWRALLPTGVGIFTRPLGSQTDYFRHLASFREGIEVHAAQDGTTHVDDVAQTRNWLVEIEGLGSTFLRARLPAELDFHLTHDEARFLRSRFQDSPAATGSLLNHLLKRGRKARFAYPWLADYPEALEREIRHARFLSIFTKGATLQYYHLLLCAQVKERAGHADTSMAEPFEQWWRAASGTLERWPLDEFFALAEARKDRRRGTPDFIQRWRDLCCNAGTARKALTHPKAVELIRNREITVKPTKSRFKRPDLLGPWEPRYEADHALFTDPDQIPYWLDYRSGIAAVFVDDILIGLRSRD
jgi:hypothetical protein